MTMPTALWIANVEVTDADSYMKYAKLATGCIEGHGGKFIVRSGKCQQLEGRPRARNVVARFPSLQAAVDCYNSPEYQVALKFAKGAAERDLVVVEELD
jgi:uncharacterized protein (DUF1330 family)